MAANPAADDIAYVTALVREHDRPRYYATLFTPAEIRPELLSLYGFAAEIARIPDQVSEPGLGEIRLQWWRDALVEAVGSTGAAGTPALRMIAATINRHRLPLATFEALIAARAADLYSDPPATAADLDGRMGETESVLFQMAAIILGASGAETAEAAGHAGIAYGIARKLTVFASDRAKGRSIVPKDMVERQGAAPAGLFSAQKVAALLEEMSALARQHLVLAQKRVGKLHATSRLAFLPLAVTAGQLKHVERHAMDVIVRDVHVSDFQTLLRIGLARFSGYGMIFT